MLLAAAGRVNYQVGASAVGANAAMYHSALQNDAQRPGRVMGVI